MAAVAIAAPDEAESGSMKQVLLGAGAGAPGTALGAGTIVPAPSALRKAQALSRATWTSMISSFQDAMNLSTPSVSRMW